MGMFDTVRLQCPYCDQMTEEQTKSGPCMLHTYTLKTAPAGVMAGITGPICCQECGKTFMVDYVSKPKFEIRQLTPEEEKELDV